MILNAFWSGILAALIMAVWIGAAAQLRLCGVNYLKSWRLIVVGTRRVPFAGAVGIAAHLLVGGIVGGLYGWLSSNGSLFAGSAIVGAAVFALVPWLIVNVIIFPLSAEGLFDGRANVKTIPTLFGLHVLYGVFLAYFFSLVG